MGADHRPTTGLVPCQQEGTYAADNGHVWYLVHLVRSVAGGGTPGPFLCGGDRFGPDAPGWSLRGGVSGPNVTQQPCAGCVRAWRANYRFIPDVTPGVGAAELRAAAAAPLTPTRKGSPTMQTTDTATTDDATPPDEGLRLIDLFTNQPFTPEERAAVQEVLHGADRPWEVSR